MPKATIGNYNLQTVRVFKTTRPGQPTSYAARLPVHVAEYKLKAVDQALKLLRSATGESTSELVCRLLIEEATREKGRQERQRRAQRKQQSRKGEHTTTQTNY